MNKNKGVYGKRVVSVTKNGKTRKAVQYLNARGSPLHAAKARRLAGATRRRAEQRQQNIRRIKK